MKKSKQIIFVLFICLIATISFTTYAIYKTKKKNRPDNNDLTKLAILVDGVKQKDFPSKTSGKSFLGIECTNGGTASWDKENWKLTINDITGPTECTISFTTGTEPEEPELNNGLIPVTWDGTNWVKADTTKEWYDYDTQWWANAVTVSSSSRSTYTSAASNTPILMNDIETMWVWIPRYEYQYSNMGDQYAGGALATAPGAITINFVSQDTVTASDANNFAIHDAFKWGDNKEEQLAGIWVAKFEMSTGATSCTAEFGSVGTGCDLTTITPKIKPNVTSWGGARIGTIWISIHEKMNGSSNSYGLTNTDAHLMKNIEWGAVTYLSQSKYGKYGNTNYTGTNKEIYQNKSTEFITGMSNGTPSSSTVNTQIAYNVEKSGTGASTTGNIYGVYDMSGGANEFVMGIMKDSGSTEPAVGSSTSQNSGWSGKIYNSGSWTSYTGTYDSLKETVPRRYYDLYDYGENWNDYTRGHLGDATKEVIANDSSSTRTGWYSDTVQFVQSTSVFFCRGGHQGVGTNGGLFGFFGSSGMASPYFSGRPALVPLN